MKTSRYDTSTAAAYFRYFRWGHRDGPDVGVFAGWVPPALALYECSCGAVEDLPPGLAVIWCPDECHLPLCPHCGMPNDRLPLGLPQVMLQVEPFRSDRLLPRRFPEHADEWWAEMEADRHRFA